MKKVFNIVLIVVMLTGLIGVLTGCKKDELDPNKEYVSINIPSNGSTYNQTGYMILDENVLKVKKVDYEDTSKYKDRTGYTTNNLYYFEGVKQGNTEVWVIDMYPEEVLDIRKYEVSVDANLNAKIINSQVLENVRVKSDSISFKNSVKDIEVNFEDTGIAKNMYVSAWPNTINVIGIKTGNTIMTVKEKDGSNKKYNVKVDSNLNVEIEEM
ncbi:MAG: hypothetical protein IKE01_03415 [Clostridia bacterium]|nr:hypothetical protein [Clostridia bacterium]